MRKFIFNLTLKINLRKNPKSNLKEKNSENEILTTSIGDGSYYKDYKDHDFLKYFRRLCHWESQEYIISAQWKIIDCRK